MPQIQSKHPVYSVGSVKNEPSVKTQANIIAEQATEKYVFEEVNPPETSKGQVVVSNGDNIDLSKVSNGDELLSASVPEGSPLITYGDNIDLSDVPLSESVPDVLSADSGATVTSINGYDLKENESIISVDDVPMDEIYTNRNDMENQTNAVSGNKEYFDKPLVYDSETGLISEVQRDGSTVPMGYAKIDVDKNSQTSSNNSTGYVDPNEVPEEFRSLTEANNRTNQSYLNYADYVDSTGKTIPNSITKQDADGSGSESDNNENSDGVDPIERTISYDSANSNKQYTDITHAAHMGTPTIQIPTGSKYVYDGAFLDNHDIISTEEKPASLRMEGDKYRVYYGDEASNTYLDPERVAGGDNGKNTDVLANNSRLEDYN